MEIRVDDKGLQKAFRQLAQAAQNPEPALKDIGEYYLGAVDGRFRAEKDHKGQPWKALSPGYAAWKAKQPTAIQKKNQLTGIMRAGINGKPSRTELRVGSDRIYAPVRHRDRPFIEPSQDDVNEFIEILKDHTAEAWAG
jgi:phage gpG-like protein